MRTHMVLTVLTVLVCMFGIGRAAEQPALSDFRIVVTVDASAEEVVLKCTAGCAWTELKMGCRKDDGCSSPIDEHGMAD